MQEISTKYAQHLYNPNNRTLFSVWFPQTKEMSPAEFREELAVWTEAFEKFRPERLFDMCKYFSYAISPSEQVFMAESVYARWAELGLKKYAHMVPNEVLPDLSVEQLFDEFFKLRLPNAFEIKNFLNPQEAMAWLES
jgi:hypothetical protein